MLNEFRKKDLKTGMIVETKEKSRYLVLIGNMKTLVYGSQNVMFISEDGFLTGDEYDENLKQIKDNSSDIEKVYEGCVKGLDAMIEIEDYKLIWERKLEVDWSNVAVDTKVLVRNSDREQWGKRYFAKFAGGIVFTWANGITSFTAEHKNDVASWRMVVLYEGNESLVGE